ncbi:MAG: CHRD domain-containing protein [Candidatus Latescibacterota bacterium]|nr:MAG: CHRD domain-containing protein [Candidatus Latescibacterota bacterium]
MRIATGVVIAIALGLCGAGTVAVAGEYSATLSGLEVVPPVFETPASGLGDFDLDATRMFNYFVSYGGLLGTEIAAHVHGPAPMGENGPVIFDLPLGPMKVGSYGPLTPQQESDLNDGLWYVSIETTLYPSGEIRGQILSSLPVENSSWGAIKALYKVE